MQIRFRWLGIAALGLAGCATVIHGTSQSVGITSVPSGASVMVDNKPLGVTPVFADLRRKDEHIVSIEMPGYQKTDLVLTRGVSGWVWGNIVIGGLIGLAVDAISGGLYSLSPAQLAAELHHTEVTQSGSTDGVYIVTVLTPNPAWQRIGSIALDVASTQG
jgi:hypothetical protein